MLRTSAIVLTISAFAALTVFASSPAFARATGGGSGPGCSGKQVCTAGPPPVCTCESSGSTGVRSQKAGASVKTSTPTQRSGKH